MIKIINKGNVTKPTRENLRCVGSRTAVLKDGRLALVYNTESNSSSNDFIPMITYSNDGIVWEDAKYLFPEYVGKKSICVSIRNTDDGRISICGWSANIDSPNEVWWDDEHSTMKENQLIFCISNDGYNFPSPTFLNLPYYGSAEIPGGMQVDKDGTIDIVYSPYGTIEAKEKTDTNCLVRLISKNGGKSFVPSKIALCSGESLYAETWIASLKNGAKMITTWQTASTTTPDQYLYSKDGINFNKVTPLPFKGQSTALTPLEDGRVMIVYNQRKEHPVGIWLAIAKPDENGLNLIDNLPIWTTIDGTKGDTPADFSGWTNFSFGEPHVKALNDGTYLLVFWQTDNGINYIKYVRFFYE